MKIPAKIDSMTEAQNREVPSISERFTKRYVSMMMHSKSLANGLFFGLSRISDAGIRLYSCGDRRMIMRHIDNQGSV